MSSLPRFHPSPAIQGRLLQVLATCCYGMQRAIEILDNSGLLMSESDANETAECLQLHLVTYAWLAAYYWEEGVLLFRFRPKHHYLFHQAVQIAEWRLNQSIFHTWDQESFLGKIKQICVKCHGATATVRVFERYLLCMAMMLEQHRRVQSWTLLTVCFLSSSVFHVELKGLKHGLDVLANCLQWEAGFLNHLLGHQTRQGDGEKWKLAFPWISVGLGVLRSPSWGIKHLNGTRHKSFLRITHMKAARAKVGPPKLDKPKFMKYNCFFVAYK